MSSNKDFGHLLAVVGQLQAQLQKQQAEQQASKPAEEPAEDVDGVALDEDEEDEANAEDVLSAQSEASAEGKKKKETDSKEAALNRLRSTQNLNAALPPAAASTTVPSTLPALPALPRPATPGPSTDAAGAPPPEVNSKTHKKEYMRLVPWIAANIVQVVATRS